MKMNMWKRRIILTGLTAMAVMIVSMASAADVSIMTKEKLKASLDNENVVILDVRTGRDWSSSEFKIKGAVRAEPGKISTWTSTLGKDKKLVLYCA